MLPAIAFDSDHADTKRQNSSFNVESMEMSRFVYVKSKHEVNIFVIRLMGMMKAVVHPNTRLVETYKSESVRPSRILSLYRILRRTKGMNSMMRLPHYSINLPKWYARIKYHGFTTEAYLYYIVNWISSFKFKAIILVSTNYTIAWCNILEH